MALTVDELVVGKVYVLERDFIKSPKVRYNFGTEVKYTGNRLSDDKHVEVDLVGDTTGGFIVPIRILKEKEDE